MQFVDDDYTMLPADRLVVITGKTSVVVTLPPLPVDGSNLAVEVRTVHPISHTVVPAEGDQFHHGHTSSRLGVLDKYLFAGRRHIWYCC